MVDRREFLRRTTVACAFAAVAILGSVELLTRLTTPSAQAQQVIGVSQQTGQGSGASAQAPSGYVYLAPLTALTGKTYAYFTHPRYGESILINYGGAWRAFSAVCTHAGCTVDFTGSSIYCPCHGASFSPNNGAVQAGPAPTPLQEYGVVEQNGALYVSVAVVN